MKRRIVQGESQVWIHFVTFLMDKERIMKPLSEIKANFLNIKTLQVKPCFKGFDKIRRIVETRASYLNSVQNGRSLIF